MVDQANLDQVNRLNAELQQIDVALSIFDEDGRIVNLTLSTGVGMEPGRSITVQTADMIYPSQMVEAIKNHLIEREQQIRDELMGLGITGVDASMRITPSERVHK